LAKKYRPRDGIFVQGTIAGLVPGLSIERIWHHFSVDL
jgi:hypothetical protein